MGQRRLRTVLADFLQSLQECKQLAADAYVWSSPGTRRTRPFILQKGHAYITEMAFLHVFSAWESFVEESFILYLVGQAPPGGRAPKRYVFPPNHDTAMEWVVPEGRSYVQWTDAQAVRERAGRFFRDGRPFAPVLRSNQNMLKEVLIVRNAIVHSSVNARGKFETLVRDKVKTLPPNLTVGEFLSTTEPGSTSPASFLEFYIAKIDWVAQQIVPS